MVGMFQKIVDTLREGRMEEWKDGRMPSILPFFHAKC